MYNVLIRPLQEEDALISYQWRNDPEIWKFTGSRPNIEITKEMEINWIKNVLKDTLSKRFAILCDNEYIGNVQLTNIKDGAAEFHIFIGNKLFWNKGISNLATYQVLYYAKEILQFSKVYLSVKRENTAAIKSYQKNNFVIIEEDTENFKMSLQLSDLKKPVVSIFVMVYNHAPFLVDCIDSLLQQKTDFNYEIVIGEDCSKDNSREILTNYQKLYPGKFKLLLHSNNIGAVANQEITYENCHGKYIAFCEGDDYWTDPLKLQKQVDFLENNLDYSVVFHKVQEIDSSGAIKKTILSSPDQEETYDLKYLAKGNFIHTPSLVFRKNFDELPAWINYSPLGDYPLNMLNAEYGLIKYLPDSMAVYRVGNGIWSSQNRAYQIINTMYTIKLLVSHFSHKEEIKQILTNQYNSLLEAVSSQPPTQISPETAAYNLSFKKLFTIIARKIKYSIK